MPPATCPNAAVPPGWVPLGTGDPVSPWGRQGETQAAEASRPPRWRKPSQDAAALAAFPSCVLQWVTGSAGGGQSPVGGLKRGPLRS